MFGLFRVDYNPNRSIGLICISKSTKNLGQYFTCMDRDDVKGAKLITLPYSNKEAYRKFADLAALRKTHYFIEQVEEV